MPSDTTIIVRFGHEPPDPAELSQLIEDEYEDAVVMTVESEEA